MKPNTHWHIATGLTGYGPDASDSDGFAYVTTERDLSDHIVGELSDIIDSEIQGAQSHAERGDFEAAWKQREHADSLHTLSLNLSNTRADSPMYAGNDDAWNAQIIRLVTDSFPVPFDDGRSRLYVWECPYGTACENMVEGGL